MTPDTNVVFDHLLKRKVRTPTGPRCLDLDELRGWLEARGCRFVFMSTVVAEVDAGLVGALYDEFGGKMRLHQINRQERLTLARWRDMSASAETVGPAITTPEVNDARQTFARQSRDLGAYSAGGKDPMPGPNDLRILLQTAAAGPESHLVTRDGHFLAHRDLIASKWRVNVHNGARLPLLLDEWSVMPD